MATKKPKSDIVSLFEGVEEKGFGEVSSDDLRTPRITIIQAMSPQRKKDNADYNPEAEEGDLFFTGSNAIISGETGLSFLPVWYNKTLVEWKLREKGGGLVKVHSADSDLFNRCSRDSQGRLITPAGETQLTPTANHYGYAMIDEEPQKCVINMTGSQLKHSRYFNTLIQSTKMQGAQGMFTPPSYSHWYLLKTQIESNDRGSWYSFSISQERVLDEQETDLFTEAKEFSEFCADGGMDQLPGSSNTAALEDNSEAKTWE